MLLVLGCSPEDRTEPAQEAESTPLYFERVAQGQRAAITDTVEVAAKDGRAWQSIQDQLRSADVPRPVDFEQTIILFAAVPVPTGGYTVEFRSVERYDDRVVAHYAIGEPAADCITAMGGTVPYQAIEVPRVQEPVVFERSIEPLRCTFR